MRVCPIREVSLGHGSVGATPDASPLETGQPSGKDVVYITEFE